jgi:glycosyltransferase involved in cell wall biosynthesis
VIAADRRALVVTTPVAAGPRTNGATLRAEEVVTLLEATGYEVTRTVPAQLERVSGGFDVGVAVSYACASVIRRLQTRSTRVWLDAVDSWLLVNGSALRRGRTTYLLRALRDGARLASMPRADLVTYISGADLASDRGSIRGRLHLVLPGRSPSPPRRGTGTQRRVVLAADWDYAPNRDGLRWFQRRILPALESQLPESDWSVAVYGTGAEIASTSRIRAHGYAENITDLYRDCDVHAAPVRFGAGVKRKVLQPLLAGLPVVTTPAGAHGLRPCALLDVRASADGFAAALVDRLATPSERQPVEAAGLLDRDDEPAVTAWLDD